MALKKKLNPCTDESVSKKIKLKLNCVKEIFKEGNVEKLRKVKMNLIEIVHEMQKRKFKTD
jgi:hypothetical protein